MILRNGGPAWRVIRASSTRRYCRESRSSTTERSSAGSNTTSCSLRERTQKASRSGSEGAQSIALDRDGAALLRLNSGGEIEQRAPVAYQLDDAGRRERVDVRYVVRGGELGFSVGRFDDRRTLVSDPTLVYSTYLGGLGSDGAYSVAVDGAGEAFVAGTTSSSNFPMASPPQGVLMAGKWMYS